MSHVPTATNLMEVCMVEAGVEQSGKGKRFALPWKRVVLASARQVCCARAVGEGGMDGGASRPHAAPPEHSKHSRPSPESGASTSRTFTAFQSHSSTQTHSAIAQADAAAADTPEVVPPAAASAVTCSSTCPSST